MTANLTIELSWPDKALSPNARVHHMKLYTAKKAAKEEAYWSTRSSMGVQLGCTVTKLDHDGKSDVILRQIAYPPANYAYDRDNLDHCLKAARDGISKALGINDRFFSPTGIEWGDITPGGKIVIEVAA